MKTYRRHRCQRRHRTDRTAARCIWPRAEWVLGRGPYACVAHCKHLTVTLHGTAEAAADAKATIDATACGGRCVRDHELVRIALDPNGDSP